MTYILCHMLHVTMHFLANARMHGYGNGHPMDTGASKTKGYCIRRYQERASVKTGTYPTTTTVYSLGMAPAYLFIEQIVAHYMTTSFDDECIPQREMSMHLMLSATKEEAGSFTP